MLCEVLLQPIPRADQQTAQVFTVATHMYLAVKSFSHLCVSWSLSLTTGCRKQPGVSHSFTFMDHWLQKTDRGQPYLEISYVTLQLMLNAVCVLLIRLHLLLQTATKLIHVNNDQGDYEEHGSGDNGEKESTDAYGRCSA